MMTWTISLSNIQSSNSHFPIKQDDRAQSIMYMYRVSDQLWSKSNYLKSHKLTPVVANLDVEEKGVGIVYTLLWKYGRFQDKDVPRRVIKPVESVRGFHHFIGWNGNDKIVTVQEADFAGGFK
eukprot:7515032-Ditylum_brightwellii.AAC.1